MHVSISKSMNDNLTQVVVNDLTLWFSYETVVAFRADGERVVSENVWSTTTGRHLASIDGGSKQAAKSRVPHAEFTRRLDATLEGIGS